MNRRSGSRNAAGFFLCSWFFVLLGAVVCLPASAEDGTEILKQSGIQGGLIVHLGCGDGQTTAALCGGDGYLVHGLDTNPDNVRKAREHIQSLGLYGQVSVDLLRGDRLPYTDNLVNLVVAEHLGDVSMDEVLRVLAPGGVVCSKADGHWKKVVKPRPGEIDEWTHFLHGPDNNAVAHDTVVGPPRHVQWVGEPKFARAHEQQASVSACVSAGGRMFYIIDEASRVDIRLPSKWFLIARDAFNGVILWKREIPEWVDQFRRFRSGPADLAFRLVAVEDRVYVTLGISAAVSELDAATGETLGTFEGTEGAQQILRIGDRVAVLIDTRPQTTASEDGAIRRGEQPAPGKRNLAVFDIAGRQAIWREPIESFVHPTVAAEGERLFYQTKDTLFCLDLESGKQLWQAPVALSLKGHEVGWESPTLVVNEGIVFAAGFKQLHVFAVEDGEPLWTGRASSGYNSPPDIFLIKGLLWKGKGTNRGAFDPATGEPRQAFTGMGGYMHPRCYRNKATDRYLLLNHTDLQLIDVESGEVIQDNTVRGTCQYGVMPANGLLYVPPDSCACIMKTKLNGLWALAAKRETEEPPTDDIRLEKGPAFGEVERTAETADEEDWPTYRGNPARSGMTATAVSPTLEPAWQSDLGGRLSGLVAAEGKVLVASIDKHTVHALDDKDGSTLWNFTTGGRVDSPPTIHGGLVLFGSADGYVYALRAADGQLVWRYRAAPVDRRVFVNGQLESVWPVHGSVLVKDGELIVTAGRSSYLDGGIFLSRLDPWTGELLGSTVIDSYDAETDRQPTQEKVEMRGVKSDLLVADGDDIYMRHVKLDLETGDETGTGVHLFHPVGLLDATWWHRSYWVMSDHFVSHWSGWWKVGNQVPSGRILSYNDAKIIGFGRDKYSSGNTGQWRGGEKYQLFAYDRAAAQKTPPAPKPKGKRGRGKPSQPTLSYDWTVDVPMLVTAMVVAEDTVFIAGPPDLIQPKGAAEEEALELKNPQDAADAWLGKKGGILSAVSAKDGKTLARYALVVPPVFDGMIAAQGQLLLSTRDGKVLCFRGK